MSFDLGVWSSNSAVAERRATQIYEGLCRGERRSELIVSPAVAAFYQELTDKWPEIDAVAEDQDDTAVCPWSCALDHSDDHVLMSCVWSQAENVYPYVQVLARKHGLVFFDPQSDEVYLPD